jgi:quercetin dioxygenase-like cupin family protein
MSDIFDIASFEWQAIRPEVAHGVFGKALLEGTVKAVLTRVAPGGAFEQHVDAYAHLFYFLSGEGSVLIGTQRSVAHAGVVVRVDAGIAHAYENTGKDDLVLLSMNIPA